MLCEICGENPATVHLTQMINNKVHKLHICEACAKKGGLNVNSPFSIADVLLGLGGAAPGAAQENPNKICSQCRMRLEDFRKNSRLGCAHCYTAFADELAPLLDAMHRRQQHVGKHPAGVAPAAPAAALPELRKALHAAIAAENFEEAARLRDQIRALETNKTAAMPETGSATKD